ncbi:transglutaminase domain-containing protein [Flavobacterium sp.]|uniref:transglutaminase domain-containing protein n=1 Tax=Flavobacterium sp. TaxID=239 RepID=UPI0025C0D2A8|nr:transglutaminase domain-containing protein [Flavobacterium sp.]
MTFDFRLLLLLFWTGLSAQEIDSAVEETDTISEIISETPPPRYIAPYAKLDSIARTVRYDGNLEKATYELTKSYSSEIEKTRAIFAWVTANIAYDYKSYNKNKRTDFPKCKGKDDCAAKFIKWEADYLNNVLRKGKGVCDGYARVFKKMCGFAGIRCSVVSGWSKQYINQVGRMGALNHAWNVVIIEEKPYYLDATWAAGYCTRNEKGELDAFHRSYNDYYWLTPEDRFLRNHFPKDTIWPKTSKADKIVYRDQPYINNHYLSSIDILSPESGVIKVKMCEFIKFKFDLRYVVRKMQVNTNLYKNPRAWVLENGEKVLDGNALKKQKYVDLQDSDLFYEFEYEVLDRNLRFIEVLFDYNVALKFKVEVVD